MTPGRGQSDNSLATSRRNSGCLTVLFLPLINSLRFQESHFSRGLCNKTMISGRSISWILCGDSRLTQQIPLPLRHITTSFGMQLTNMIFTTPKRDHRERLGKNIGQQYCWCSLMWLMPPRSLSNCDYELNFYLRLILGPIHSNQVMGTDPVGSYHGTRNSRSNSVNPTYRYQSHD